MAIFGNGLKTGGALVIGAAAVLLAPVLVPAVASVMKPLAKAAIKGSLLAYENARIAIAEAAETIEDIAAEARSEIAAEQGTPKAGAKKSSK